METTNTSHGSRFGYPTGSVGANEQLHAMEKSKEDLVFYINNASKNERTGLVEYQYFILTREEAKLLQSADNDIAAFEMASGDLLRDAFATKMAEDHALSLKSVMLAKKVAMAGYGYADIKAGQIYEKGQLVNAANCWDSRSIAESLSMPSKIKG
jgi:hypothetical protein